MTEAYLEVIDMLVALRTARTEVGVKFDGDDADYSSIVTALNARHGIMVIDSPTPSVPLWLLSRGRPVTVTTATQGREIKLKSQFLEPFMPDLNYGLQLQIPQLLGTKQPRSAFRVMLDEMRNKVNVSIWDANNNQISGVARNISRSGLGIKTTMDFQNQLPGTNQLMDCTIDLQDNEQIDCRVEICNVQRRTNGDAGTYLGGRMRDISRQDSQRLKDFIQHLQRQRFEVYA